MKRFNISFLFTFAILIGIASFAQSPLPAQTNKAVPASTASDTVDVQHATAQLRRCALTSYFL
jgi:hypothetical protein